jgi:signal peptidase I
MSNYNKELLESWLAPHGCESIQAQNAKPQSEDYRVKIYIPKGRSMYPFLQSNCLLIVKKVPEHLLRIGDLIVFSTSQQKRDCYTVHRLIKKIKTTDGKILFQAKGDNNHIFDPPVLYANIIGKVFFVVKDSQGTAKKLLELNSWYRKILNYLLAKYYYCKTTAWKLKKLFLYKK